MKKLFIMLMAGMMIIGMAGCGQDRENRNVGNQEQTAEKTEENEAKESDIQDGRQSVPLQENEDTQAFDSEESDATENTDA